MKKQFLGSALALLVMIGAGCAPAANTNVAVNTNVGTEVNANLPPENVACTLEARECPDGSYVGRVPPSCEFAPCPTVTPGTAVSGTLTGVEWTWVSATEADGTIVSPSNQERAFTVTFGEDGRLAGKTDCNSYFGSYTAEDGKITYTGPFGATKMFCEGAQEGVFLGYLEKAQAYSFGTDGTSLTLALNGGGSMLFRK